MKVCLITGNFPPKIGGIATFSWEFALNLSQHPDVQKVSVVVFGTSPKSFEKISSSLEIFYFPETSIGRKAYHIFQAMHRFQSCDIFHATTLFPEAVWTTFWGKSVFRKKTYVTIYGTDALSKDGSLKTRLAKRYALHHVTQVISFSHSTNDRTQHMYHLDPHQSRVIYPGISQSAFVRGEGHAIRKQYGILPDDFLVLTVCRLVERKGVDDIIRAIYLIQDPCIKLLIVGDGEERERLASLAEELQVASRIFFAGNVSYDRVGTFYEASDLFVLPSFFKKDCGDIEGLGIVFLEAQLYGIPVIGTDSGGIPEAIGNNYSGFIVPERRPDILKERILSLASDKDLYQKFCANAVDFVTTSFSWEGCINSHVTLYKESI